MESYNIIYMHNHHLYTSIPIIILLLIVCLDINNSCLPAIDKYGRMVSPPKPAPPWICQKPTIGLPGSSPVYPWPWVVHTPFSKVCTGLHGAREHYEIHTSILLASSSYHPPDLQCTLMRQNTVGITVWVALSGFTLLIWRVNPRS